MHSLVYSNWKRTFASDVIRKIVNQKHCMCSQRQAGDCATETESEYSNCFSRILTDFLQVILSNITFNNIARTERHLKMQ